MSTHETKQSADRSSKAFPTGLRGWKALLLAALIPLAAACTETVTGLNPIAHEDESSAIDQRPGGPGSSDFPVPR